MSANRQCQCSITVLTVSITKQTCFLLHINDRLILVDMDEHNETGDTRLQLRGHRVTAADEDAASLKSLSLVY